MWRRHRYIHSHRVKTEETFFYVLCSSSRLFLIRRFPMTKKNSKFSFSGAKTMFFCIPATQMQVGWWNFCRPVFAKPKFFVSFLDMSTFHLRNHLNLPELCQNVRIWLQLSFPRNDEQDWGNDFVKDQTICAKILKEIRVKGDVKKYFVQKMYYMHHNYP